MLELIIIIIIIIKSWLVFDFEKLTLLNIKLGVLQFGHKSTERSFSK
jgi:hypothetical protein